MAKIDRFTGNLEPFASDSLAGERTVFGDTSTSDTLDDNINADFLRGWGIVGVNENPTKQDFNAVAFTLSQVLAYIHQMGVPEWDSLQEYPEHALTQTGGAVYISLSAANIGNDPTSDAVNWKYLLNADDVTYDNSGSTLSATDVNAAIDEVDAKAEAFTNNGFRGFIYGLEIVNDSTDSDHDIEFSAGICLNSNFAAEGQQLMELETAIVKQIDAAWSVGDAAGGLDTGTVAADTWYYCYIISDGTTVDALISASATAPTMPAGYTYFRRIGAILTDVSANILPFVQRGEWFQWTSPPGLDINTTASAVAVQTTLTYAPPVSHRVLSNATIQNGSVGASIYIHGDQIDDDAIATSLPAQISGDPNINYSSQIWITPDSSGSVSYVAAAAGTTFRLATVGWEDRRGKDGNS